MAKKSNKSKIWLIVIVAIVAFFLFVYPNVVKRVVNYTIPAEQTPIDLEEIAEELSEEELEYYSNRLTFEVNFYENADNTGTILQEIDLDYFTDASLTAQYAKSTGMQYVGGEYESINRSLTTDIENTPVYDFYYYDTTAANGDVVIWSGNKVASTLKRSSKLIVKIDNKPYLLQMTGSEIFFNFPILAQLGFFTNYYNYGDLFADIMQAVKTNSKGYGDYYLKVDLSDYFSIYKYDEASSSFITTENVAKTVIIESVLKFHYYERGAQTASDSFFGQIALDKDYNEKYCNLFFDANGGVGEMSAMNGLENSEIILPQNSFLKAGKTFAGWNTEIDGTGTQYNVGDTVVLNKDITLYAQWGISSYTLKFDNTYGDGTMGTQTFIDNVPQQVISNEFVRDGFDFVSWYCFWDYSLAIPDNAEITITSIVENGVEKIKIICGNNEYLLLNTETMLTDEQGHNTRQPNTDIHEITIYALWQVLDYVGTYVCNDASVVVDSDGILSVTFGGTTYGRETFSYTNNSALNRDDWILSCFINDTYSVYLGYLTASGTYKLVIGTIHPPYRDIVRDTNGQKIS